MLTEADKLKARIADKDRLIAVEEKLFAVRAERLSEYRGYIDQLHTERKKLEAQLAREEAPLVKPVGHCVTIEDASGVAWNV